MGSENRPKVKIIISILLIGSVIGLIVSYLMATAVKETSDKNYCMSCHTMKPMVEAYTKDIHGGAGAHGIEVKCVSCHLPEDSVWNYLVTKAKLGANDVYTEFFTDTSKIDWEAMRKERKHFVHDSACLNCHTNLKNATESNMKAFLAHRDYFNKNTTKTCVECHQNVGHKNLGIYLNKSK